MRIHNLNLITIHLTRAEGQLTAYNKPVNAETISRLNQLNAEFYQTFAQHFSGTRLRLQPGVAKILKDLPPDLHLLDLGCGNGELAHALSQQGFAGCYTGLDSSEALLVIARQRIAGGFPADFIQADLSAAGWENELQQASDPRLRPLYDGILAFAVLHHLPGWEARQQVLHQVHSLLSSHGRFIHSEWQFLNSPRLRGRLQPWEAIGLSSADVDPGDYLLDWRQGGYGLRYVHHFSFSELQELAAWTGFQISETFHSDGAGGNLGLYQVWLRV